MDLLWKRIRRKSQKQPLETIIKTKCKPLNQLRMALNGRLVEDGEVISWQDVQENIIKTRVYYSIS